MEVNPTHGRNHHGFSCTTRSERSRFDSPNLPRKVPIVPPTETLPPLSFPPALSGSNADLRGFVSDMSSGGFAGAPQYPATVSAT